MLRDRSSSVIRRSSAPKNNANGPTIYTFGICACSKSWKAQEDGIRTAGGPADVREMAQVLLDFGEALYSGPNLPKKEVPPGTEPEYELWRVKRRKGRRALANFEGSSGHHPGHRVESRRARLSELRGRTERERRRELADRVHSAHFERIRQCVRKYA